MRSAAELTLVSGLGGNSNPCTDGVLEAGVDPHVGVQTGRIAWEIEDFDLIATRTAIGSRIISASSIQRNSSLSLERGMCEMRLFWRGCRLFDEVRAGKSQQNCAVEFPDGMSFNCLRKPTTIECQILKLSGRLRRLYLKFSETFESVGVQIA